MAARPPKSLSVLFIGNSFTARNNVPGLIAGLAEARGRRLEHKLVSAGGASLRMHWNKGEALAAIRGGGWDFVVLQEQSTLPVKNPARMHENIRLFDAEIGAAGANTALYLTWARRHAPAAQAALTDAYTAIAREINATLVPVGIAWQKFLRAQDEPILHDKDNSHPTLAGSYLAACVFYAVLFKESPVGIPAQVTGLSRRHAALLQEAAGDLVTAPRDSSSLR